MSILIVNKLYHPWIGGVESIVQQCAEYFYAAGHQVTALVCQPQGSRSSEELNGVRVIRAASLGMLWGMPLSFDFFHCFFREFKKVDIIAIHHPFPLADLALFLMRPTARIIVHYHSDIVRQGIVAHFLKPFFRFTLSRAEKIIVSNKNLLLNSALLLDYKNKCVVIPFPINIQEIDTALSSDIQHEIKETYGDYILFVGRFSYYKGIEYLIDALRTCSTTLICIGDGAFKKRIQRQVAEKNLLDRVVFLPPQSRARLLNFMAAAKLCVLPSIHRSEAFGIVLAESLACSTPVISTELRTGTSFVNQNGKTGIVVPPRDTASLANAINLLLSDEGLRKKYGIHGRARVDTMFSYAHIMEQLSKVYYC